jgi:hypothetical protein
MGSHLGESKAQKSTPRIKRVEKDLLPTSGKESVGVISKAMSS